MGSGLTIQDKVGDRFEDADASATGDGVVTLQSGISHEEKWLEKLQELYKLLDKDGSGSIGKREIKHVLRRVGKESREESRKHARNIMQVFDRDDSGKVTLQEMVAVFDSIKTDEAKAMITDMLDNIHSHRRRNHLRAPKANGEADAEEAAAGAKSASGKEQFQPRRYKSRPSVVEMDIESQDVIDTMLRGIAEFQREHRDATRMMLVRCVAELKKCNSIPSHVLEGLEGDEKKTMQGIQAAASLSTDNSVLTVLEFMLSQLPPSFGERKLKTAPKKSDETEST